MKDYPVLIEIPVQWGEMDALGHVNHARIVTWMETARMALFDRIGLAAVGQPTIGPILANVNVNYFAPIHYPARIVSATRVSKVGRTSFTLEYGISYAETPQDLLAGGTTVIVLYDYQAQSKTPVPDALRMAMANLHGTTF